MFAPFIAPVFDADPPHEQTNKKNRISSDEKGHQVVVDGMMKYF
jgi:hypothetical protein